LLPYHGDDCQKESLCCSEQFEKSLLAFMDSRRFLVSAHCALEFFALAFITGFKTGFFRCAAACVALASWAANKELNFLRASSVEFNVCFSLRHRMRPDRDA